MRVRYAGDSHPGGLEKGCVYNLSDITKEGLFEVRPQGAEESLLLFPCDFELAEVPLSRTPHYAYAKPEWTTFYSGFMCCRLEIGEDDRLQLTHRFFSHLAFDGCKRGSTFVSQCACCKKISSCERRALLLYRRNCIKCADRVSDDRFRKSNTNDLSPIEEELERNSHLYTDSELAEAKATLSTLKNRADTTRPSPPWMQDTKTALT